LYIAAFIGLYNNKIGLYSFNIHGKLKHCPAGRFVVTALVLDGVQGDYCGRSEHAHVRTGARHAYVPRSSKSIMSLL
jgi:hypothetical protein